MCTKKVCNYNFLAKKLLIETFLSCGPSEKLIINTFSILAIIGTIYINNCGDKGAPVATFVASVFRTLDIADLDHKSSV